MTHRNQFRSIYSSFKKRFHREKGHFTSKQKGTFCVIFKVGALPPLASPIPTPLTISQSFTSKSPLKMSSPFDYFEGECYYLPYISIYR